MRFKLHLAAILVLLAVLSACATLRDTADEAEAPEVEEIELAYSSLLSAEELSELRLSPADRFATMRNQIPDMFQLPEADTREVESNIGFRIQLLTTQDIAEADSMSLEYYDWAGEFEEMPFDRTPEAYVSFRQPSYRLRIGDFTRRADANLYLSIVRVHFPGAWVVMDTIDPELAP